MVKKGVELLTISLFKNKNIKNGEKMAKKVTIDRISEVKKSIVPHFWSLCEKVSI